MNKITQLIKTILSSRRNLIIFLVILLLVGVGSWRILGNRGAKVQYQTAQVTKGDLITNISASGTVTNANNVQITIQAGGVIKDVLVKNGDSVSQGQTIATLTLDQASQQKAAAAWSSYLSAKATLDSANAKINSLQSAEFKANQKFINDAIARSLATNDPTYIQENADWLQAEADYKNQQGQISQAQAALASASLNLSQLSSTITAPAAGIIKGLTITPGAVVTLSSSSSNSTSTSQVLGSVYQAGPIQAVVNLSEIDSVNVAAGQKVTMTLDAFPNATFTGRVTSINTNGVVSSGVTTYPAVISFDGGNDHIYPNMSVSANIITNIKNGVILIPSAALQNNTVRVFKNGNPTVVNVEVGDANDTEVEIKSGISEGDEVIVGTVSPSSGQRSSTSPFNPTGGFGGGALRPGGFGGGGRGGAGGR